jgi:hypothetical protein
LEAIFSSPLMERAPPELQHWNLMIRSFHTVRISHDEIVSLDRAADGADVGACRASGHRGSSTAQKVCLICVIRMQSLAERRRQSRRPRTI